ncbi:acyl carrier protein [Amycolatopsis umgeniensis]|uniref:Acyl carrier protein n=1 Tax=Amycolatopsis umgeniensis TaxID=336628 RepID=A0A841BAV0_9PSEU|nr:phosphopantetheine-binding protein [Amycolatopsis umgeniensis]MBB5855702.1 acyl carrier protein [Amycolatopsis umgeniensis]
MSGATLHQVLAIASAVFERRTEPSDNFFALGGDSIAAVELAAGLEEALDREVETEIVTDSADFAALAEILDAHLRS